MSHDACVTHWLIAKINRSNNQMPNTEVVLNVMRSETKLYLMLKTYLQM